MSTEDLDALLERMPKIAEAVNAFSSESVQQEAFASLISAFDSHHRKARASHASSENDFASETSSADEPGGVEARGAHTTSSPAKRRKRAAGWSPVELDLHPEGRQSFDDFVAEKQPANDQERYAVVVYYLEEVLKINPITMNEIGTVFRLTSGWKEPANLKSGLNNAASRKMFVDISNMSNIRIATHGRNFIKRDKLQKATK